MIKGCHIRPYLLFICTFFPTLLLSQNYATVRGSIKTAEGEPLVDARVNFPNLKRGGLSNLDGIYSIDKIPAGKHLITVSFFGMDSIKQIVEVVAGKVLTVNFILYERITQLDVVEIEAERDAKSIYDNETPSLTIVKPQEINTLPSLGTPDLAQYLQVLPGVVFTGDQGGQIYIRGGTPIQNLTLLDGAIIYSPFHSVGLFSVFDTDILRSVSVFTAGFPAEYGGRISSVMDIRTRSGNFSKHSGKIHVNPFTSGALIEGPLGRSNFGKPAPAAFIFSARNCYLDQSSQSIYSYIKTQNGLPFSFIDLFGKITLGSAANQLNLFAFHQRDNAEFAAPNNLAWRSTGYGANFNFLPPGSQMIMSGNITVTNYNTQQLDKTETLPRSSSINGFNSRLNFAYILNGIDELSYGIQLQGFNTKLRYTNALKITTLQEDNNSELAVYTKYRKTIRKLVVNADSSTDYITTWVLEPGLRMHFYNDQSYAALEPRLRIKYLPTQSFSIEGMTGLYSQNLAPALSDRDIITLFQGFLSAPDGQSNKVYNHALQIAWHYVLGTNYKLGYGIELSLDFWYKDFKQLTAANRNRMDTKDPAFITETGTAKGIDFVGKYNKKNTSLNVTYSLSKVDRKDLSTNITYFPVFDRRHTLNITGVYKRKELRHPKTKRFLEARQELSFRFTLGSGFPFTPTEGFFEKLQFRQNGALSDYVSQNGELAVLINTNDGFNRGRLPFYHRADLSVKQRFLIKDGGLLEISFNILNLYNRANIFYVDRVTAERINQLPFLPSLGLSITW